VCRGWRSPIAGLGVAAIAVAAIVVSAKSEPKAAPEPAYIVVEKGSREPTASRSMMWSRSWQRIRCPNPKRRRSQRQRRNRIRLPKTTDLDALTRTFGKQSPAITGCFKQHPGTSEQVSVRIQIDTRGAVKAAEVLPATVGASPLGECIAAVARKTSFGPQPKPASFRVPLVKNER
jgi:hypothetical protein